MSKHFLAASQVRKGYENIQETCPYMNNCYETKTKKCISNYEKCSIFKEREYVTVPNGLERFFDRYPDYPKSLKGRKL